MSSYFGQMQMQRTLGKTLDRYGGPVGLAGKLIGLGQDELEAGVPGWSWFLVGAMAGGVLAYSMHDRLRRIVGG